MDFTLAPEIEDLRLRVRSFVEEHVLPLEADPQNFSDHENIPEDRLAKVREKARKAGLWAPQSPKEYGGMDLPIIAWPAIYEEAARSIFGPLAINCMAPDDGNMNLLKLVGTREQKEKWLKPIVEGRVRSTFTMTEPAPGGGSDPSMIQTKAEKKGDRYIIRGRKWFATGADGAAHFILVARTSNDKRKGLTAFLYHKDQPGWRIVRRIPIMAPHEHGGHCELEFDGLEIPRENVLLEEGDGLKITQIRLGPARLTHCMRWLGFSKRCMEIAQAYVANARASASSSLIVKACRSSLAKWRSRSRSGGCSQCTRPGCSIRAAARARRFRWPRCRWPTRCTRLPMWRFNCRAPAAFRGIQSPSGSIARRVLPAWWMVLPKFT
jgi:acyl-CoA dehydrogenase